MNSITTKEFREALGRLPAPVQAQADREWQRFRSNPGHPSLAFKPVRRDREVWSVRIGLAYRALCSREGDQLTWFWIGSHTEYDHILRQE